MSKYTSQMFNVTHEPFKVQLASKGFTFKPRAYTEVPSIDFQLGMEDIPQYLEKEYGHRGIFWVNPDEPFEQGERRALLRYLSTLEAAEKNHIAWMDDQKKLGITVPEPKRLRAIRFWIKEIRAKLDMIQPIDEIPSYFDAETRKKLGLDDPSAVTIKTEELPKKRGRKPAAEIRAEA